MSPEEAIPALRWASSLPKDFCPAFFEHQHSVANSCFGRSGPQALYRFFHWFIRQAKGPVVHGNHASCTQIQKTLEGVLRTGVHIAKVFRMIGADGKQCQFGMKTAADLAESIEVRSIASAIHGMLRRAHDVSTKAAMKIAQHARAPVLRGGMRYGQLAFTKLLPPFHFVNAAEAEARDDVADVRRNDDLRSPAAAPPRKPGNGAERWSM